MILIAKRKECWSVITNLHAARLVTRTSLRATNTKADSVTLANQTRDFGLQQINQSKISFTCSCEYVCLS